MPLRQPKFDIRQTGKQILMLLTVLAGLNAIFYVMYTRPAVIEYRGLLDNSQPGLDILRQRETEVTHRERFLAGLKQAEKDLRALREEVLATRAARLVDVQRELNVLAKEFSIDLETVSYINEILADEGLERFAMVVPLEGGYTSLRKFLQAVEDSDKFLLVERVGLVKGKQGGVLLSLNIVLATYFNAPEHLLQSRRRGRRLS